MSGVTSTPGDPGNIYFKEDKAMEMENSADTGLENAEGVVAAAPAPVAVLIPRTTTVYVAFDYICPNCSQIHSQAARLKSMVDGDLIKTLDLLRGVLMEANPGAREPTEADYDARDAAEKEAELKAILDRHVSNNPKGDA